uniref:Helically-extended SH3 domain-containing protein n=1 Tax=Astyanax mexicanus TaxID=7994 RepID=A0A8B9J519_ASTMX
PAKEEGFTQPGDFRNYDQEIRVLYEAAVLPTLACKKFSGKHLVIKPGDVISVITRPQDGKVIGRNSEGKYIYDDVGEGTVFF